MESYAQEKIFKPLEMQATRFQADHGEPVPNRAHGYRRRDGHWRTADVGFDLIGSGGMYSNIEDMLRWARNFEKPVIGETLLATLQTPGKLVDGRPTPGGYALGIIERKNAYFHTGGAAGYSTVILRVPKSELTVVCLCNVGNVGAAEMAEEIAAAYTGDPVIRLPLDKSEKKFALWKPGEAAQLARSYWSEELFSVWRFAQRDDSLWLQSDGPDIAVTPGADGSYSAGAFEINPARDASGTVTGFDVGVGRARGISFARR